MSDRARDLAVRYSDLRLQCALQRRAIGTEVQNVMTRFGAIDRFAILTRGTLLQPRVIVAGIIALLAFGRVRGLHTVGRVVLLMAAARRLWNVAKLF
jgi:hypothetical protein